MSQKSLSSLKKAGFTQIQKKVFICWSFFNKYFPTVSIVEVPKVAHIAVHTAGVGVGGQVVHPGEKKKAVGSAIFTQNVTVSAPSL